MFRPQPREAPLTHVTALIGARGATRVDSLLPGSPTRFASQGGAARAPPSALSPRPKARGGAQLPSRRGGLLLSHPRTVLCIAVLAIALLALLGRSVEQRLSPTSLEIPGTPSAKGTALMREHFGESAPFAILLQGPPGAIERQGPQLVKALHREVPQISTLSPWDRGSVGPLRPGPRRALIIADFHVDLPHAVNDSVDHLNSILGHSVKAPVRATQTSYATLSRQIQDRSIDAAERSEL